MSPLPRAALLMTTFLAANASANAALPPEDIRAGLATHDRALHIKDGWIRDPYIMLAPDGFYYLTGTTPNPGDPRERTEPYNTGLDQPGITGHSESSIVGSSLRVWRSPDLGSWEYLGVPFTMDQGYWAGVDSEAFANVPRSEWRLWAPELFFHDGKWMFVHTSPSPVKGGANLAISRGDTLSGPFSHPMKETMRGRHDPSLFLDDDGTWYLLWGNTSIAPLEPGFAGFADEPRRIDPADRVIGHEGATVRKIGDKYVHLGTAWSTDNMRKGTYNLYYCTADVITGPYGPRQFAGRFLGHGTPFQDKEGRWWCTAFYNANVPTLSAEEAFTRDLSDTAYTINQQGTTLVPLDIRTTDDGDVLVRAKDPAYANPGPEEMQPFPATG